MSLQKIIIFNIDTIEHFYPENLIRKNVNNIRIIIIFIFFFFWVNTSSKYSINFIKIRILKIVIIKILYI